MARFGGPFFYKGSAQEKEQKRRTVYRYAEEGFATENQTLPTPQNPQGPGSSTRPLTEGAIMVAITVLLCMANVYLPLLGSIGILFCPIPMIILVMRHSMRTGILATIAAGLILTIFIGPLSALYAATIFGGFGLVFGYCFRKGYRVGKTLLFGFLIGMLAALANVVLTMVISGLRLADLMHVMEEYVDYTLDTMRSNPALLGALPDREEVLQSILRIIPGTMMLMAAILTLCNYFISVLILRQMRIAVVSYTPYSQWRLSPVFSWAMVLALALGAAGNFWQNQLLFDIFLNLIMVLLPVLFIGGFSVLLGIQKQLESGFWIALITLGFLFFLPAGFFMAIVFLGACDPLFDFRNFVGKSMKR